jgi:nicotinate-nucleotide--dimethylbenzimidazole phosphoribosyltransferase
MAHFTGLPFDDIKAVIESLPLTHHHNNANNDLAKLSEWYYQHSHKKNILKPFCVIFATSHGITNLVLNVSTKQKLENATKGNSSLNKLCAHFDIGLKAFDLAIEHPTKNIYEADAFQESECAATIAYGMEAIAGEPDLVILSSFSVGGIEVARGLMEALKTHNNPLELLRQKGGREIAALLGAIIAARLQNVPLVLDGLPAFTALEILKKIRHEVTDHCLMPLVSLQDCEEGVEGVITASLIKAALVA